MTAPKPSPSTPHLAPSQTLPLHSPPGPFPNPPPPLPTWTSPNSPPYTQALTVIVDNSDAGLSGCVQEHTGLPFRVDQIHLELLVPLHHSVVHHGHIDTPTRGQAGHLNDEVTWDIVLATCTRTVGGAAQWVASVQCFSTQLIYRV